MLAKELKIRNLKRQREHIKNALSSVDSVRKDGNTAYGYAGDLYPEVRKYFEDEGFTITKIESDKLTSMNGGLPTYIFTVGEVELTEGELKQAEEFGLEKPSKPSTSESPEKFKMPLMGKHRK